MGFSKEELLVKLLQISFENKYIKIALNFFVRTHFLKTEKALIWCRIAHFGRDKTKA